MQLPDGLPTEPVSTFERRGSAIAHGSGLIIGVPLILIGTVIGVPPAFAYIPSAIVAYLIARSFRRRRLAWGAFQGMQATVIQLTITLLMFVLLFTGSATTAIAIFFLLAVLLFLYSLWGAWDTLFGEDFRYIIISRMLYRVSETNLRRLERRRRLFRPYSVENDEERGNEPPR